MLKSWIVVVQVETYRRKRQPIASVPMTYTKAKALAESNLRMGRKAVLEELEPECSPTASAVSLRTSTTADATSPAGC
jgi:hypothetical protein